MLAEKHVPRNKVSDRTLWLLALGSGVIILGELLMWLFTTQIFSEVAGGSKQNYLTVISFCLPATLAMLLIDAYILPLKTPHRARTLIAIMLVAHICLFLGFGLGFAASDWQGGVDSEPMRIAMRKGFAIGFLSPHHLAIIGTLIYMLSKKTDKKTGRLKKIMIGVTVTLALLGGTLFGLSQKYEIVLVSGNSMYPTLKSGEVAILEKDENFKKEQIAFFEIPEAWKEVYKGSHRDRFIKRIVAVEGDTLSWDGTWWSINGEKKWYVSSGGCEVPPQKKTFEEGEMFVVGDVQFEVTLDSREAFCRGLDYVVRSKDIISHGMLLRTL